MDEDPLTRYRHLRAQLLDARDLSLLHTGFYDPTTEEYSPATNSATDLSAMVKPAVKGLLVCGELLPLIERFKESGQQLTIDDIAHTEAVARSFVETSEKTLSMFARLLMLKHYQKS